MSLLEESTHSGSEGIDKLRTVFSHVIGGSLDLSSDLDLRLAAGDDLYFWLTINCL